MAFIRAMRQGLRTGVYGGAFGQTVAVLVMTAALFVFGSIATGHLTWGEVAADPTGALWRSVEPTVRSLWP